MRFVALTIVFFLLPLTGCVKHAPKLDGKPDSSAHPATIADDVGSEYRRVSIPAFDEYLRANLDPDDKTEENRERLRDAWASEVIEVASDNDGGVITKPDSAFLVLAVTRQIQGTAVGYAGSTSPEVHAFRILLKEPHAAAAFRVLYDRADIAGKFYALVGLQRTDKAVFEHLAPEFFKLKSAIMVRLYGCVGVPYLINELETNTRDGTFSRFFKTGDTDVLTLIAPPKAFLESQSKE